MKIQALTMAETQEHLQIHFPYYGSYLKWMSNERDEGNTDFILKSYKYLVPPIERTISAKEREQILHKLLNSNRISSIVLPKNLFLLNSYNHFVDDDYFGGVKWPWIFQKAHNNRHILKTKRLFTMCGVPQQSFYDAYGFICTDVQPYVLFRHIFFLPFLMRWQDIDILDYAQKQVIHINQHLTVYTVKTIGGSNTE